MSTSRKRSFSHDTLMGALFTSPVPQSIRDMENAGLDDTEFQTTIRFSKKTAAFFSYRAKQCGDISMQAMVSQTLNAIVASTIEHDKTILQVICERFKYIFEAHRIPPLHIKQVVDSLYNNNLPLGALTNDEILKDNYTPGLKQAICDTFGVRGQWLDASEDYATNSEPVYSKNFAYEICRDLTNPPPFDGIKLTRQSLRLITSERDMGLNSLQGTPEEVIVFIVKEFSIDAQLQFRTYHPKGLYLLSNQDPRSALLATLKLAKEKGIDTFGASYSQDTITKLKQGKLPAECFKSSDPSIWNVSSILVIQDQEANDVEMQLDLLRECYTK